MVKYRIILIPLGTYIYKFTSDITPGLEFFWYEFPVDMEVNATIAEATSKQGAEKLLDQILLFQKIYSSENIRQYDRIEFDIVEEESE